MAAFMNVRRNIFFITQWRTYNDDMYRKLFRFNRENVQWLANHFLNDHDDPVETRGGALSPTRKMEVFLRSLGDPGFQQGVGVDIDVNQSTVSRTLVTVSEAIYSKRNNWIKSPNTNELLGVAINEWANTKQMLALIGVIDCTHIKITKPSIHGDEYVNRKGVCSINVQATCNSKEVFTSVHASWPGSVHDSRIWRNSVVLRIMFNNVEEADFLGDEGYGIAPWLLTPFKNPNTHVQENYNLIHAKERCVIERYFGLMKRRFPMLQYTFRLKTETIPKHFVSAFVLHNIAKHLRDPYHDFDPVDMEIPHQNDPIFDYNQVQIRNRGTQSLKLYFAMLTRLFISFFNL